MTPKFSYSFCVWPDETRGFPRAVFDLFRGIQCRAEMDFTEQGFADFRETLDQHGLTLREVSRRPHHEEEIVR